MCSLVMAGTLAVSVGLGSPEVLGKLQAAGSPVVVEMGAPPSTAVGGVVVVVLQPHLDRADRRQVLVDALLVLAADDVREPVEVGDDGVEDALLDGVRVVDRRAARAARAASTRAAGAGRGRRRERALEVEVEDAVGIGIGQHDLTGAPTRTGDRC